MPEPIISWERNGVGIALESMRFVQTQSGTLRIRQPTAQDSGTYTCKAQNIAGSDLTQTRLIVKGNVDHVFN